MSSEKNSGTKVCKHCKSEIPAGAKICPHCRKKQGMSKILIVVIVLVVLGILSSLGGGKDKKDEVPEKITYTAVDIQTMYDDLESNPAAASDKYKDAYIEFSGSMDVIDSDLKYISLFPTEGIHFVGVRCNLNGDAQKDLVKSAVKGDIITVKGKCTQVGEVLGYTVDVKELNK